MRSVLTSFFLCAAGSAVVLSVAACSGGEIAVGKTNQTEQELKKRTDGTATGNGQTCSWEGTAGWDTPVSSGTNDGNGTTPYPGTNETTPNPGGTGTTPSPGAGAGTTPNPGTGSYTVGATFKSLDGCNDCACSPQGIMCTMRACAPGGTSPGNPGGPDFPTGCTMEAKVCPDGSSVGRSGPNCEFTPCPTGGGRACTEEAKHCPDGTFVSRTGPNCEFAPCPGGTDGACPADAKLCPDGSYVSRTYPGCQFAPCP